MSREIVAQYECGGQIQSCFSRVDMSGYSR
jgi:hypothetical protein